MFEKSITIFSISLFFLVFFTGTPAGAFFSVAENFDGFTTGDLNGQGNWAAYYGNTSQKVGDTDSFSQPNNLTFGLGYAYSQLPVSGFDNTALDFKIRPNFIAYNTYNQVYVLDGTDVHGCGFTLQENSSGSKAVYGGTTYIAYLLGYFSNGAYLPLRMELTPTQCRFSVDGGVSFSPWYAKETP